MKPKNKNLFVETPEYASLVKSAAPGYLKATFIALKSNKFLNHLSVLISGTAIAQLLLVGITPILTRLYSPDDFGVLQLFISILSVLAIIVTMRFEMAIVLPDDEKDAVNLMSSTLFITIVISIGVAIFIVFFGGFLVTSFGIPEIKNYLWLIPVSTFFIGVFNTLNFWCIRQQKFKRAAYSRINQSLGVSISQISLGIINLGAAGLLGGQILGQMAASITIAVQVVKNDLTNILKTIDPRTWFSLSRRFYKFPLYSAPQAALNGASQAMAPLLLGVSYGASTVGFFALGMKLVQLPAALIGESFNQVFIQRLSHLYNNNEQVSSYIAKMTLRLAAVALLPAVIIFFSAPIAFELILGDTWGQAGIFSSLLILWLYFGFINSPSVVAIQVFGLQKMFLIYEIILLSVRVIALYYTALNFSAFYTIGVYSVIGAVFNIILIALVLSVVKMQERKTQYSS